MHKPILCIGLLFALLSLNAGAAQPFAQGQPQAGKQLFDGAQCNRCHVTIVGGDGNGIFTRHDRIIHNADALLNRIRFCEIPAGVHWTAAEETDVAAFLNRTYYHFK